MKCNSFLSLLFLMLIVVNASSRTVFLCQELPRILHKIEIKINGRSTLGKYGCQTVLYKKDSLTLAFLEKNVLKVIIPMTSFDCGNRIMTNDFQNTVKVKTYSSSYVTISNLKPDSNGSYKCTLVFAVINKTFTHKDFILTYNKISQKASGVLNLTFSEMGLIAPSKLGGIIRVRDEITINFDLFFVNKITNYKAN